MKNKITNIVVFIFSFIFLVGILYSFYIDLIFFITKKPASGKILQVDNFESKVLLKLSYYNDYLGKEIQSTFSLQKKAAKELLNDKGKDGQIPIFYAKYYPNKIYVESINKPRLLILVFEIVMILIMVFSIYASTKNLKEKG